MNSTNEDSPAASFTQSEVSLFDRLLQFIAPDISHSNSQQRHRLYLGAASKLVDLAADVAAIHRPGMRVVELGILAERLEQLALNYDVSDTPQSSRNPSTQK